MYCGERLHVSHLWESEGFDRIAWLENSLVQAPLYHPVTKDLPTEKRVVLLIDLNNVMDKVY